MNPEFTSVVYSSIPRNTFDLSFDRKFSANMGRLTPTLCTEVLPGDTFNLTSQQMIRFAPLVSPMMHRVNVYTHFFFVPNRILWAGWEEFITNPLNGANPHPFLPMDNIQTGTIGDYLGLPTNGPMRNYNAFPAAAMNKIWNDYYRDENLQNELVAELIDGDCSSLFAVEGNPYAQQPYQRAWNHDYFTSCLPFAQKGTAVTIPIGGTADIDYVVAGATSFKDFTGGTVTPDTVSIGVGSSPVGTTTLENFNVDNSSNLIVDLESATAITINDLRQAERLQEWLEKNARGGNRYIETILVHFGVRSSDSRLQRPEYLGGGKSPISISEVLQMSESGAETPQGNMAGHGINVGTSHQFSKTFEEHGFIIGIMSVMPEAAYANTMPKWSFRLDPMDYYWPSFANLGEQEVLSKEVDGQFGDDSVFGYIPRYSEYKFNHNTVHGDFKTSLDFWHMARKFEAEPILNDEFIKCDPTTRVFAVEEETVQKLYCMCLHQISAQRPIPRYAIPTL